MFHVIIFLSSIYQNRLQLVEVGPHFGDCMLWAAAYFGNRVQMTAVEPVNQVVELFRQSITANKFQDQITLHHAFATSKARPATKTKVKRIRVDEVVSGHIDILKIHTNGGEDEILKGCEKFLKAKHKIPTILIHSADAKVIMNAIKYLKKFEYDSYVEERFISEQMLPWLEHRIKAGGGIQLLSRHATSIGGRLTYPPPDAKRECLFTGGECIGEKQNAKRSIEEMFGRPLTGDLYHEIRPEDIPENPIRIQYPDEYFDGHQSVYDVLKDMPEHLKMKNKPGFEL